MQKLLKTTAEAFLRPAGVALCRTSTLAKAGMWARERERHLLFLNEADAFFRATLFPTLPAGNGRAELLASLNGCSPTKAYFILNYLHEALRRGGDVCELGVAEGATSALMANEIRPLDRVHLWLYDSFEGLPRPTEKDVLINDVFNLGSMAAYEGKMAVAETQVRERLAAVGFPQERTHVVRGFIDRRTSVDVLPERIAFAYLDFDLYEPIALALRLIHQRLVGGGYVVVDDYGWFSSGAATAVDEFHAEHRNEYELIKPPAFTGGFVILGRKTESS